jgi:putative DNA primase/helicase
MAIEVVARNEYSFERNGEEYDYIDQEKESYKIAFLTALKDKKYSEASEILVRYVLMNRKIYTTKDDRKSEMWVYKEGVYIPNGKSEVKEMLRNLLGTAFSMYYYNQAISKIEADTFIDIDKFFKINYKAEIPVQNGILNIFTKELKPFDSDKIFFNKLPVTYNPKEDCPKIDTFLNEVLANEEDKLVFYELGGFALMKEYRFEKAFMFHGSGRNGKGKTIDLLRRTIGVENCSSITIKALTPDSFQISELFGKMLNIAGDLDRSDLKDTGMFKSLTGRDLISGKRKFLRDIIFENYAKFVFACNDLPMVYDTSKGFWERWILLDFPYYFADKKEFNNTPEEEKKNWKIRDPEILDKITTPEELSGLLNKFLEGLQRLMKHNRFSSTQGSEDIKSVWIRRANSFIAFCMDKLKEDMESKISKKELRKEYSKYCKLHKVATVSDVVIKRVLQDMFGCWDEERKVGENLYQTERLWGGIKWK